LCIQNFASNHSNVVFDSQGEGAPDTLAPYELGVHACLSYVVVREHLRLSWVRVITQAHLFLMGEVAPGTQFGVDMLPMGVKYV